MTAWALDVFMAAGAALALLLGSFGGFARECEEIPQEVLRLHIPANSDSDYDQSMKLAVRDYVLEEYGAQLAGCDSVEEAADRVRTLLPEIEKSCTDYLAQQGADYGAKAELTEMYFTTRQYDEVTLPAGEYQALRITLGSGKGHNWWCVMFPALCIPLASEPLPEDELPGDFVTGGRVEIRFAVFEFFKSLFR
ncbi:MAG: stage II sporulation protein R [Oscillospiraceae bacterium]